MEKRRNFYRSKSVSNCAVSTYHEDDKSYIAIVHNIGIFSNTVFQIKSRYQNSVKLREKNQEILSALTVLRKKMKINTCDLNLKQFFKINICNCRNLFSIMICWLLNGWLINTFIVFLNICTWKYKLFVNYF